VTTNVYDVSMTAAQFGVDSSSRFPFRARTNKQTRLNALPMPEAIRPAWVIETFKSFLNCKQRINVTRIITQKVFMSVHVTEEQSTAKKGATAVHGHTRPWP